MSLWIKIIVGLLISTVSLADSHHPQEFLTAIRGKKNEGAQIVQHFCSNCHAEKPLIPLNAPSINNKEDWQSRIQQGWLPLMQHLDEGFGAMPARGGCFECTDEQLRLAILALLPEELQKRLLSADPEPKANY